MIGDQPDEPFPLVIFEWLVGGGHVRQPGFEIVDVDAGMAATLGSTDDAFGRVRAMPEER
jgi:hypothetical protein